MDLEAAAALGNRIYWIGSHSTNSKGKANPSRRRLFATDVKVVGDQVTLTPVGLPYLGLVQAFNDSPALRNLHLAKVRNDCTGAPGRPEHRRP